MLIRLLVLLMVPLLGAPALAGAQAAKDFDAEHYRNAPLPKLEMELAEMGKKILKDEDFRQTARLNRHFKRALGIILERPESYEYSFDSIKTVSRIRPADNRFRLFTWQRVIRDSTDSYRRHHYYGYVQRRYTTSQGNEEIIVIPLNDSLAIERQTENMPLTNEKWVGALYYPANLSDYGVLTYEGTVGRLNAKGNIDEREVNYYVLLGYNGYDHRSNYKMIDVLSFDPEDSSVVKFGAPIFNVNNGMKSRMIFKYSDNSPFSLNQRQVVTKGAIFERKVRMLVFDHLDRPRMANPSVYWDKGSDGTADAMYWTDHVYNRHKGFFMFVPNVNVYQPGIEKYDPEVVEEQAEEAAKRLQKYGLSPPKSPKKDAKDGADAP